MRGYRISIVIEVTSDQPPFGEGTTVEDFAAHLRRALTSEPGVRDTNIFVEVEEEDAS